MEASKHFKNKHSAQAHLSFEGFHQYLRQEIAGHEEKPVESCQVVEAHLFRGRYNLGERTQQSLESDRFVDQLLMYAGVVTHYHPIDEHRQREKGIDVWLALEAYDLAVHKRFDVMVLITGDQDFVPLVRKLNGIATRVMLVGMHAEESNIYTSKVLMKECSHVLMLNEAVAKRDLASKARVSVLFNKGN